LGDAVELQLRLNPAARLLGNGVFHSFSLLRDSLPLSPVVPLFLLLPANHLADIIHYRLFLDKKQAKSLKIEHLAVYF
jgi:hypothetical protein